MLAYDRGRDEIIKATSIDQIKDIRDKAEALRRYWAQRKDVPMEAAVSAMRLRADYRIGEISKGLKPDITGRPKKSSGDRTTFPIGKQATLKAAGISFQRAAENENLTKILTPKQVDALCRAAVSKNQIVKSSTAYLLQWKDDQILAKFRRIKSEIPPNLHVGDFREFSPKVIPDDSVELVFVDPPYDRESIPLYEAAAKEAKRILKPGGNMISYVGQVILPDVLPLMMAHLDYFWIGAHVHDGGPMTQMLDHGIAVGFKPLLWFVKDHRANRQTFIKDTVLVKREKDYHRWQQAIDVAKHFIAGLTVNDGLVVDFFGGGGTTAIAAQQLNRPWQLFEIDEKAAVAIWERLRL
jgi:hypothetical protein